MKIFNKQKINMSGINLGSFKIPRQREMKIKKV